MDQNIIVEKPDVAKWVIAGMLIGIVMAVLTLEYYGYIQHSKPADTAVVEEFKLLVLSTDDEQKVSPKSSGKIAMCVDGYLLLRPDNGKDVAGVLVDSKNRAIEC